ncbi:preprotein translocase subunit SecY [Gammaproteobacteria bacterium]|nr:preprotein translocase subunit SecY [Gammaproteobacteria bacterium]
MQRILFLIGALIVFRIGTHVPVPGVDSAVIAQFFSGSGGSLLGVFNLFSGGALERASVFALGVMPYITASIIIQIMTPAVPKLDQLKKEGESGRRKISQMTRYATVGLALFQASGIAFALQENAFGGQSPVVITGIGFWVVCVASLVAGTMFLVWLGEQITERGIGNGMSLLIFAGIVSGLPGAIGSVFELVNNGSLSPLLMIALFVMALGVVYGVVFFERAQRRITVNYAKRQQGRKMMQGSQSYLPLKINMSGVLPPIFAFAVIGFPASIAGLFGQGDGARWLNNVATALQPGQPIYLIAITLLIMFFTFFSVALLFNPTEMADNLKRQNAFLPGIRPGNSTARYIDLVVSRLTLVGAIYLIAVSLLPTFLISEFGLPFYFGGTSLLIVVVVIMDLMNQIQSFMLSRQYENLMKKSTLTGGATGR